jgi:hypothetical protein
LTVDIFTLMRRDHDDIDRGFAAMASAGTSVQDLGSLVEVVRLALSVHSAAQAKVMETLLSAIPRSPWIDDVVTRARTEHIAQRVQCDKLTAIEPGTNQWYEQAIELRAVMLHHVAHSEQSHRKLRDEIPVELRRRLASEYATERMRVLASTSPRRVAERRDELLLSR